MWGGTKTFEDVCVFTSWLVELASLCHAGNGHKYRPCNELCSDQRQDA